MLGFTPRQWPFIFVLVGNWLFAATFFALAKLFWHWVPTDWTLGDRIALVIKDAVIAILPAVLAICIVAAQRLDPSMFVGRSPKPNSAVDINNRFILNTVEQFILYFIGNAGIALYCPPQEARTLIILTALFLMGRVLFWVGYHYNPYMRAFGFGITFYPTVTVYLWLFHIWCSVFTWIFRCLGRLHCQSRAARSLSAQGPLGVKSCHHSACREQPLGLLGRGER